MINCIRSDTLFATYQQYLTVLTHDFVVNGYRPNVYLSCIMMHIYLIQIAFSQQVVSAIGTSMQVCKYAIIRFKLLQITPAESYISADLNEKSTCGLYLARKLFKS